MSQLSSARKDFLARPNFSRANDLKLSTTAARNRLLTAIPISDIGIRSKMLQATTEAALYSTTDKGAMVIPMREWTSEIHRSRKMAQESLFSEDRHSPSAGQQGQDQKHHERDLCSCDQMGMDGEESNHERSPERETTESTRCSDAGRDHGISQGTARSTPHDDRAGRFPGLRRGELIGLRWQDVDFENLILHIRRSVVAMVEGAPKTEASLKDVPLDAQTAESLWAWRRLSPYPSPGDWVFASPHMKGRQPYWPGTLWRYYGKPALQRAKVTKQVSYHTFRHTFGTLLNANGENPKVVQELLRHASLKVTTDVYMQAVGSTEARGAEQSGKAGAEGRGFGDQTGLSGSNWIMKKNGGFVEVYCFVGVPDGI